MRVTVNDRGKFEVRFSTWKEEETLRAIPTARKKPRQDFMTFEPFIHASRAIHSLYEKEYLFINDDSQALIDQIEADYKEKRRRIRTSEARYKKNSTKIPVPLKNPPMDHQVRAFGFSSSIDCSALLMEQGTGKTYVTIALISHRYLTQSVKKVLVVCPKPVIPVWPREFKKHADFQYNVVRSYKFKVPRKTGRLVIWVVNYDKIKTNEKVINNWKADMMVLDESHKIKNRSAQRSKAIERIGRKVKYKNILTGTPLGQSPLDIYSQYLFLDPDVFGKNYSSFQDRYADMGGFKGYQVLGYKNLDSLADKAHSIAFRTTKEECLDLPNKTFQTLYCQPSPKSKKIYREMDKKLKTVVEGEEVKVKMVVSKMAKLRQITGGLVKNEGESLLSVASDKISVLRDYLEGRDTSKKIVIFVSFTHEITLIGDLLKDLKIGYLTLQGSTSNDQRETLEETFRKDSRYGIVVVQITTGAEGLDFTAANTAIFYSPTFSFIYYSQACARLDRIGQEDLVTYINLVMEGTIDEDIVKFLGDHSDLSREILEGKRQYRLKTTGSKSE